MSMQNVNDKLSICEVIRKANDLCQSDSNNDKEIRRLLEIAEGMGKVMFARMLEMGKELDKDVWIEWENDNKEYAELVKKRNSESYKWGIK
jgi:hypothetical protein